jgi:hypothetical protein
MFAAERENWRESAESRGEAVVRGRARSKLKEDSLAVIMLEVKHDCGKNLYVLNKRGAAKEWQRVVQRKINDDGACKADMDIDEYIMSCIYRFESGPAQCRYICNCLVHKPCADRVTRTRMAEHIAMGAHCKPLQGLWIELTVCTSK